MNAFNELGIESEGNWFAFWKAYRSGRPSSYWVVDRDHVRRNLYLLDGCACSAWFDTEDEGYTWAEAQVDDDMQWILRDPLVDDIPF